MASTATQNNHSSPRGGEFERQRGELLKEIAESFELVLANINKLNRNLEAVITVGNEFSSVEALWSTFENVMGKEEEGGDPPAAAAADVNKAAGPSGRSDGSDQRQEDEARSKQEEDEEEEEL